MHAAKGHALGFVLCLLLAAALPALRADVSERMPLADRALTLDLDHAGNAIVAVGTRGHILRSRDGGASWQQVLAPTRETLTAVDFIDPRNGWVVGHHNIILRTRDGGTTWDRQIIDPEWDVAFLDVLFRDDSHGFAVGAYGEYWETFDGGKTWAKRWLTDEDPHFNAITAAPNGYLYIAGERGTLLRSVDNGATWEPLPSPYDGSWFGILAVDHSKLLLFGLRGRLYFSADRGMAWKLLETGIDNLLGGAVLWRDDVGIVVGHGGRILWVDTLQREARLLDLNGSGALSTALRTGDGALVLAGENGVERLNGAIGPPAGGPAE